MNGPTFLLVYGVLALATVLVCRLLVRAGDASRVLTTPLVPVTPDPYDVAYLQSGSEGVFDIALVRLRQCGEIVPEKVRNRIYWTRAAGVVPADQPSTIQTALERAILAELNEGLTRGGLRSRVAAPLATELSATRSRLRADSLLAPPELVRTAWMYGGVALAVLIGVAISRIAVSLVHGYRNIAFLIIETIVVAIVLSFSVRVGALSDRGRRFVDRLRHAYPSPRSAHAANGAQVAGMLPLFIGLYGAESLGGTDFSDYGMGLRDRSAAYSGGGDSGGCGSSGGSGGCGGGGCGGGGCGSGA